MKKQINPINRAIAVLDAPHTITASQLRDQLLPSAPSRGPLSVDDLHRMLNRASESSLEEDSDSASSYQTDDESESDDCCFSDDHESEND